MNCGKCGGTLYTDTDHYGRHETCLCCGASRVIEVAPSPDLWTASQASEGPGGPRGGDLARPYGKVLRRG